MSKIIKLPKTKPITCACCGCVYEFESGDEIITQSFTQWMEEKVIARFLKCPNCLHENNIEFEKEIEND